MTKLSRPTVVILNIIAILLINNSSYAQAGFIGKKHEISIEMFNAIDQGVFSFNYKFSPLKRKSFLLNFGVISNKRDGSVEKNLPLDQFIPNAKFNGKVIGIGMLYNENPNRLNMPIGYYVGVGIDYCSGNLDNIIPANQILTNVDYQSYNSGSTNYYSQFVRNTSQLNYTFKVTNTNFYIHYGKDIYLFKNITLDLGIKFGLSNYRYTTTNLTPNDSYYYSSQGYGIAASNSSSWYSLYSPQDNINYNKAENFNLLPVYLSFFNNLFPFGKVTQNGEISSDNRIKSTWQIQRFIFIPQIKIGYMF